MQHMEIEYHALLGRVECPARCRLNLSQGAAAQPIDGASGDFSGKIVSVSPVPVGSIEGGQRACDGDKTYAIYLTPRI
jgi:hypothetical protein